MKIWELIWGLILLPVALADSLIQIPATFPSGHATINGKNFTLYTASNFSQWQQGFKGWHVKKSEAMLFKFPSFSTKYFWMKGTVSPLDIIFLDENMTVTNIVENAKPCRFLCKNYSGKAKYVLEVKGGMAKNLDIKKGSKVSLLFT